MDFLYRGLCQPRCPPFKFLLPPDEYYVIESANPKIQGFDGATMSFC